MTCCDPIDYLTAEEIYARILATRERMIAHVRAAREEFVWHEVISPEHLGEVRMAAMQRFLKNIPEGLKEGRYRPDALPHLGFDDDEFDLTLCSAHLFTNTEQLSADFPVATVEEMCRVASEACIFPLLKSYGGPSQHLEPVLGGLRERGYEAAGIIDVPYEFQRGGDQMLAVREPEATALLFPAPR